MVIVLTIVVILILISIMNINIRIDFHLKNKNKEKDNELLVYIKTLFGLISYKLDLPYIKMRFDGRKNKLEYKTELEKAKNEKVYAEKKNSFSVAKLKSMINNSQEMFQRFKLPIKYIINKLRIKKLHMNTEYDIDDAAITGIVAGILYTLQSNILLWLKSNKRISDCKVFVQPLFQQENIININFSCIIQFKLGHIINGGIKSLIIMYRRR